MLYGLAVGVRDSSYTLAATEATAGTGTAAPRGQIDLNWYLVHFNIYMVQYHWALNFNFT